jgi:hypothetical protein
MNIPRKSFLKAAGALLLVGVISTVAALRLTAQSVPESGQSRAPPVGVAQVVMVKG